MNDLQRSTHTRFLVLGWLCLLATVAYIHRSCFSVPVDMIESDSHLDRAQMSHILAAFFLGYSIFQLPGGWLGDRLGSRVTLTLIIILWSAATAWTGLAGGFIGLYASRLVNGAAQAAIFPCCVNTVSKWFPAEGRAFPNGMLGSFMSVGGVIGTALTAFLLGQFNNDWRLIFLILAVPGFVCAVLFFWWFRDRPQDHSWVNDAELRVIEGDAAPKADNDATRPATPWLTIFTSVPMLLVCGQQFCRAAGYSFFLTWFPTFMQKTRQASVVQSGYYAALPLLGVVIGSAFGGALMDRLFKITGSQKRSRRDVAVLSLLGCSVFMGLAYFVSDPLLTAALLFTGSVGAGMCGAAGYTVTIDMGGRHIGAVFSVMNTAGNIGAFVMPLLVERYVAERGWSEVVLLLAGLYFAAALCWMMINVEGSIFARRRHPPSPHLETRRTR